MAKVITPVQLVHDKVKTYHVDVNATVERAREVLLKEDVQSIELRAVGQEITKVSLIAIRLEELNEKGLKFKIVKMITDNQTEKSEGSQEREKIHLVLRIVLQKFAAQEDPADNQ